MSDVIEDFKDFLKERIKNPFLGSLLFFWLTLNWRSVFFLIISDLPAHKRIDYVSENYFHWQSLILWPIIGALGYVLVFPFLMWLLELGTNYVYKLRKGNYFSRVASDYNGREKVALAKFNYQQAENNYNEQKELNEKIRSLEEKVQGYIEMEDSYLGDINKLNRNMEGLTKLIRLENTMIFDEDNLKDYLKQYNDERELKNFQLLLNYLKEAKGNMAFELKAINKLIETGFLVNKDNVNKNNFDLVLTEKALAFVKFNLYKNSKDSVDEEFFFNKK